MIAFPVVNGISSSFLSLDAILLDGDAKQSIRISFPEKMPLVNR